MMFVCKVCGYRYNIVTNFESNRCILCRSISSPFYKSESKIMEHGNPCNDRQGPVSLESE